MRMLRGQCRRTRGWPPVREVPFDDPQSVFGPDERSVRAWIDLTRDPVTRNLETKLPWIGSFESARITRRIITGERPGSATPLEMFSEIGTCLLDTPMQVSCRSIRLALRAILQPDMVERRRKHPFL